MVSADSGCAGTANDEIDFVIQYMDLAGNRGADLTRAHATVRNKLYLDTVAPTVNIVAEHTCTMSLHNVMTH